MVANSNSRGNDEYADLREELTKDFAPSFILKEKGQMLIGIFTGEMNLVPSVHGDVLVMNFYYEQGVGENRDGEAFKPEHHQEVSYWFMGQLAHNQVLELKPTPGEVVGIYNNGVRRNRSDTFSYNDIRVRMPNRTPETKARKVTWDDVKPVESDDPATAE